jgi:hypothetical protein
MRLITLANCGLCEPVFGIAPLTTSPAMFTPLAHARYELIDLPTPDAGRAPRPMPWEEDDDEFIRFRATLPDEVTGEAIYERVALPLLRFPVDGVEQRTDAWGAARAFAVTASQFASAASQNPNQSANALLKAKTYPKREDFRGNPFTEWGSQHEVHAEEAFIQFLKEQDFKGELTHASHLRDPTRPFIGFSPDALLWSEDKSEVALVEYKCPAYRRSGPGHPYAAKNTLCVPQQYMPQIQGSLHVLRALFPDVRCARAWFVVWQPHQFFVTHIPYVDQYASRTIQHAESYFRTRFLPACADAVKERDLQIKKCKE